MELKGRNATWLELAVAPLWRFGQTRIRIHRLSGGREHCLGIRVDERWLCANDGRLTVFGCRASAVRFLELLRIDQVDDGEASDLLAKCGCDDVQCLRMGARGLRSCDGGVKARGRDGEQQNVILSRPSRAGFRTDLLR